MTFVSDPTVIPTDSKSTDDSRSLRKEELLPRLEVTLGEANEIRANVFVQVHARATDDVATINATSVVQGSLCGPFCRWSTTLPSRTVLRDLGKGKTVAAVATVGDPAFWSPELPNLYRLESDLSCGDKVVATWSQEIGLRRLGIRGHSFWLDGKRRVPRGVAHSLGSVDLTTARSSFAAVLQNWPEDNICTEADEIGVWLMARLWPDEGSKTRSSEAISDRLKAIGQHPSVCCVVLSMEDAVRLQSVIRRRGTLLVGCEVDGVASPPEKIPSDIDFLLLTLSRGAVPHVDWINAHETLPLVAWEHCEEHSSDEFIRCRQQCDALQSRLAAWVVANSSERVFRDWAGYVFG